MNHSMTYLFSNKSCNINNLFVLLFLFFLTSCGGGGSNTTINNIPTAKEAALEKIMAYAEDGNNSIPNVQDYFDVGASGINNQNISTINSLVDGLEADDVDTTDEIITLTTQLGINLTPIANAGEDKTVDVNQSITITGSGTDSDGSIQSYTWKIGSNILATTASFSYTPTTVGTHKLSLTVSDNQESSASDSMLLIVTTATTQDTIKQFFNYGQSLSLGTKASPLLTSSQPYKNIMFNGGLTARANPGKLVSFIPLVEGRNVESQSSATANNIIQRIINENGIPLNNQTDIYLASNPGAGARKISELSIGTIFYDTILTQTQAAKDIAQELGILHQVSFMTFMQGESNYTNPPMPALTYAAALSKLINDLNSDVSEITNQLTLFPMINYQIASHRFYLRTIPTVALGHLYASKTDDNINLAVPMYIFDYVDNLHTDNQSNRQIGNYFARTYKRVVIDKIGWKPLQPSTVNWQEKTIDIMFDVPVGPIVFDTSWVAAEINKGFDIWNSDFSEVLDIIQSVTIIGQNTVRITMSMDPPTGSYVSYAFGRDVHNGFSGRTLGPRGNLRDSAGDSDSGPFGRMDNYSVIFSEQKM